MAKKKNMFQISFTEPDDVSGPGIIALDSRVVIHGDFDERFSRLFYRVLSDRLRDTASELYNIYVVPSQDRTED